MKINKRIVLFVFSIVALFLLRQEIGHGKQLPEERLRTLFPDAEEFTIQEKVLTPEQIGKIEKRLGRKLSEQDKIPVFYIAKKGGKSLGLAFFSEVEDSQGIIQGGVALDPVGKIKKITLYEKKISDPGFLDQFVEKGFEDSLQVGKDITPMKDTRETSEAIALLPRKTLLLAYELLLKTPSEKKPVEGEAESLKELMHQIQAQYFVLRDYFKQGVKASLPVKEGGSKKQEAGSVIAEKDAVTASQKLVEYIGKIPNFEPPKNKENRKEFLLIQKQIHEAGKEFAKLIQEGKSEEAERSFEDILMFVGMAHKRFSDKPVDIDHVHEEEGGHKHEEGHEHHH